MPGLSHEVFNTLELALSDDINDLQSLVARDVLDAFRWLSSRPRGSVRNVVLGGLTVTASGSDFVVNAGALMQDSSSLAPVPTAIDSTYRVGVLRNPFTVVMPVPVSDTYYLIEAQVAQTVTSSQVRDIYNPSTDTYTPTLVPKQRSNGIVFQLVTGGANAPSPSGGDWVPIAIVFRPAGGGPATVDQVIDVRQLATYDTLPDLLTIIEERALLTGSGAVCRVFGRFNGPGGMRMFTSTTPIDITDPAYRTPSTVLVADRWYYLYLAPWAATGLNPRTNPEHTLAAQRFEGVLVLSSVAPSFYRFNSAPLDLPAPFAIAPAPIASSYCIGAVRRNAANTAWITTWTSDGHEWRNSRLGSTPVFPGVGLNLVNMAAVLPDFFQEAIVDVQFDPGGFSSGIDEITVTSSSGAIEVVSDFTNPAPNSSSVKAVVHTSLMTATNLGVDLQPGPMPIGSVLLAYSLGWRW